MVTITENQILVSVESSSPYDTLSEFQIGIILAIQSQFRNSANEEAITIEAENATGNFVLFDLLQNLLLCPRQIRHGLEFFELVEGDDSGRTIKRFGFNSKKEEE